MKNIKLQKLINYFLVGGVIVLLTVWGAVFWQADANRDGGSNHISFLDVGQGDAALLAMPDSVQVLFDAGRDGKTVEQIAHEMPFFDRKIEFVVISHFDSDHVGGLDEVMRSYDIGEVVIASIQKGQESAQELIEDLENSEIKINYVSRSDVVYFKFPIKGKVLWPDIEDQELKDNDLSLVMQIEGAGMRVLMTGDIENKGQTYMFAKNDVSEIDTDILKFPHHGSVGAFSEKLFELTTPRTVIISVGKNSYGHPSSQLLDYLKNKMIDYLRTDEAGTVRIGL